MPPGHGCCILNLADISAALGAIRHLLQGPSPLAVEMAYTGTPSVSEAWPYASVFESCAANAVAASCGMVAARRSPNAVGDQRQYIALRYIANAWFGVFHDLPGDDSLLLNGVGNGRYLRDGQGNFHRRARLGVVNPELSAQSAHALAHSADTHARLFEVYFF